MPASPEYRRRTPDFGLGASTSDRADEALKSSFSFLSLVSDSTVDSQELVYTVEVITGQTLSPAGTFIQNVGKIPVNGTVMGVSALSFGIKELTDSVTIGALLGRDAASSIDSTGSETVIRATPYSQFIMGRFDPDEPYHPVTERFRSFPVNSRYLNLEFTNNGATPVTFSTGYVTVRVSFMQADSNNTATDGYPTGGVPVGPIPGFPALPTPGSATPIPPPPEIEPVKDLSVSFNLIPPGGSGYGDEYKPTFTWVLPPSSVTATASAIDRYMNWILYRLSNGVWTQITDLQYRPYTASTPLGILLDPFPFLSVTVIYRIQIEIVTHQPDYPEQTASTFLTFGENPYPTPPPPVINVPSAPTALDANGGQYEVLLWWDVPTSSGGSLITSYDVQQAPDESGEPGIFVSVSFTPSPPSTATYATVSSLLDETKYWFRVAAINGAGTGDYATLASPVTTGAEPAVAPGAPRDLKAVSDLLKEVPVSWAAPLNNGGKAITQYELQFVQGDGSTAPTTGWTTSGSPGDYLSKTVSGLSDAKGYWFKVLAQNSVGAGPFTEPVKAITSAQVSPIAPGAPVLRTAIPGPTEASLVWEPPAYSGTTAIINYKVEKSIDPATPASWSQVASLNDTKVTVVGLAAVLTSFRVSARNADPTYGAVSNLKSATPGPGATAPSAPTDFTAKGGVKQINTAWEPPVSIGGTAITQYTVGIATSEGGVYTNASPSPATSLKFTVTLIGGAALADDTTYWLRVSATNIVGTGPVTSPSIQAKTNAVVVPPGPPRFLQAQGLVQAMYLTWDAPLSNGGAALTTYSLERALFPVVGAYAPVATVPAPSDQGQLVFHIDTGLAATPTAYSYRVRANTSVVPTGGAFSVAAHATTVATAVVPDAPVLQPLSPGMTKILATWTPGASSGGAPLTGFNVEISSTSATAGFATAAGSPVSGSTHTLTIPSLTASTPYWVRTNAINSVGASAWSNVEQTTTSSATGSCDGTCQGTAEEWNGSAGDPSFLPVPNPGATPLGLETSYGAEMFWNTNKMTYGVTGSPGCVKDWILKVYQDTTLIATYPGTLPVTIPRNFYILHSPEGEHGKDPTTFVVDSLVAETSYTLRCEPQGNPAKSPICGTPPYLSIPFTTGKPATPPPSTTCEQGATSGTAIQWSGTVTYTQENGTKSEPSQIGAAISWSAFKIKFSQCVTSWTVQILQTATSAAPIATSPAFSAPASFNVTNHGTSWSSLSPQQLLPGTSYYLKMIPLRNSAGTSPPSLLSEFKTGTVYSPMPKPPIPTGDPHLPQTYITTYGLPSWGKTDMASRLSQEYYSAAKPLNPKNGLTVDYNQHQSWAMVRAWAQGFFSPYVSFIVDNPEVTNAMVLVGDWAPILPGAGLPVQAPTLGIPGSGDKYGQVAGSNVLWDVSKANYSYCAPNGPVDFGLSYDPDDAAAPPPSGIPKWWDPDPDMLGCPLILDFLLPLARALKGAGPSKTDRVVCISVNGDVSKNGNDGAYGSLDCGNYTAADLRRTPSEAPVALLNCILDPLQVWEPKPAAGACLSSPTWGPMDSNKTQTVTIAGISGVAYSTLVNPPSGPSPPPDAGTGAPGKPISQNNQGSNGMGTTGLIVSSVHHLSSSTATFSVTIKMSCVIGKGWRGDGGFSITNVDPTSKYRANAKVYFAAPVDVTDPAPSQFTTYNASSANPAIGAFQKSWVVQQSKSDGSFPATNVAVDPANITNGGILGQITATGPDSWTKETGAAKVTISLAAGVTAASIKIYRVSGPTVDPPVYDTTYKHRIYFVNPTWDPNQDPLPVPPTDGGANPFTSFDKMWNMRIGNLDDSPVSPPLVQCIYNYGTASLKATANVSGGATHRALGSGLGNSAPGGGGWLPDDWDSASSEANFPAYWNVAVNPKFLPTQPGGSHAPPLEFAPAGGLVMGGGNVFIGNGSGSFCGRGAYFDPGTVSGATQRPGLKTLSGTGTGVNGTFFTFNTSDSDPIQSRGRVGFPLDNLHQLYILLYRINQKIMEFNYVHSQSSYAGTDKNLRIPYIGHVHHDKESYQVNKTPRYPVCDDTGEISTAWLMGDDTGTASVTSLNHTIQTMSSAQYLVWKQNRRQASVAYEKYLYNRYMPAEFLPDWRTGGANTDPATKHYLPLDSNCTIPGTSNRNSNGFGQIGGEVLWSTVGKPWNQGQHRNFSVDPASVDTAADTGKGIGNYSNDLRSRTKGDTADGIQRYGMGWVNYAVTAWAYGTPFGQTVGSATLKNAIIIARSASSAAITAGDLFSQAISGATGKVAVTASAGSTPVSLYVLQGILVASGALTVYPSAGAAVAVLTGAITAPSKKMFTSQGTNEAYQELYNIGEVKPPVDLLWLYDTRTVDPNNQNPIVPSPNITVNQTGFDAYVDGTATGVDKDGAAISASIDSIYNSSSLVLKNPLSPDTVPKMFFIGTPVTISKSGQSDIVGTVTAVYTPTANGPFDANFIKMVDPATSNKYGATTAFTLPVANSNSMIPNGLGSACIPGGSAPTCPTGASVFCPAGQGAENAVGPYYKLNAVTNTLIGRILNEYGAAGDWPFLGDNSVNLGNSSPALTDLWLRFDAINTGVIPLDGRGFATNPGGTGAKNGPKDTDGSFAPLQSPYVSDEGEIELSTLYSGVTASTLDGKQIVLGSDADFKEPKGPRQAIALFANEYIGGALTLDPTARPGTKTSAWSPVVKGAGAGTGGLPGADYLPGTIDSWVGSRGMEVVVYAKLSNNAVNKAMLKLDGTTPQPPFSLPGWRSIIETDDATAQATFKNIGWSFSSNTWGGEYNGLSALQSSDAKVGYKYMKDFLKSCASMFTGAKDEEIGQARAGLYTIGFVPETWLRGPSL